MRGMSLLLLGLLASLSPQNPAAARVPACTTATASCTEWVTLGGGPARSLIYRSYSLDAPNASVRRALIMVHGTNRNADHYFSTAMAAAFLAGSLDDSIVIAPRIASAAGTCHDTLAPNEVSWSCTGDSWRSGGDAASPPGLTSFDFIDQVLKKLANRNVFPNLGAIVVAGHSAGGQFVARYQMANRVHDTLGVPVTYVVANPSSYAWPDSTRPQPIDDAAPDNAKGAWESEQVHTKFSYGAFDASACANYNRWPAGLENRSSGYTAKTSDEQLKKQLVSRPTTFLFSQVDTLPLGGFDSSCPAMAQGATRRARGEAYVKYVDERLGAKHAVQIVPECGHNDRCVYTTDSVFPVIFPKAQTSLAGVWTAPRTPDGHPDLQGIWTTQTFTPLERPARYAGKEFLTDEEAAELAKLLTQPGVDPLALGIFGASDDQRRTRIRENDPTHYDNALWLATPQAKALSSNRTSLITDPADGRLPPLTPEARQRAAASRAIAGFDSYENRPLQERCIIWTHEGPPMMPPPYNDVLQIFQTPDFVVVHRELEAAPRIIPTDGRPHVSQRIRQWGGDSTGRWEGDTLVVDTTNFNDKTAFQGSSGALHVVERFRRVSADRILYQFTVEDPHTWTRPWSGELPMMQTEGPLYEYACHEGNYGLPNTLSGARFVEKEAAQGRSSR